MPRPGEVSLTHNGALFLDELPEFPRNALEMMRQPLEDGTVCIVRAAMSFDVSCPLHACHCNESLPVRIPQWPDTSVPLYDADDTAVHFQDFQTVDGPYRHPH